MFWGLIYLNVAGRCDSVRVNKVQLTLLEFHNPKYSLAAGRGDHYRKSGLDFVSPVGSFYSSNDIFDLSNTGGVYRL